MSAWGSAPWALDPSETNAAYRGPTLGRRVEPTQVRLTPDLADEMLAEVGDYVEATAHIPWCPCMRWRARHLCDCAGGLQVPRGSVRWLSEIASR